MAGLMLTPASPVGNLDHPSICIHHEGNLVVGVFERTRTMYYDLIYRVGRLDKESLSIQWGIDRFYSKGCNPNIALILTGGEHWVVETHQSQAYKACYYCVGKVNEGALKIEFGAATHIGRGLKPKVCAINDRNVIIVSEKARSLNGIQYYYGEVNVHAKSIKWREECVEFGALFGTSPSISINEEGRMVMACVYGPNLNYIVGDLRLQQDGNQQGIAWGGVKIYGKGTNPAISINSRGRVVEAHQKGLLRTLYISTGEFDGKSIAWNHDCFQYTLGRFPSISIADDGYVIESHKTNLGYQTFLSHGKSRGPDRPANVPERPANVQADPADVPDVQLNIPDRQVEEIEIEEQGQ